MGKLLFYHFRVTKSRLENKKFRLELLTKLKNKIICLKLLIRKMKKQNLDIEVARDFFIEMKYYTSHNYSKRIKACRILRF